MWLSKEERKLLVIYHVAITESLKTVGWTFTAEKWYSMSKLVKVYQNVYYRTAAKTLKDDYQAAVEETNREGKSEEPDGDKAVDDYKKSLGDMVAINAASAVLAERGLIKLSEHQHDSLAIGVSLTVRGYDLGRKYSNRLTASGLWFAEYKDHWGWIVVSFLGGIIGALVVNWLT